MVRSQGTRLTIGGLAAAAGVSVETVRYYQRIGLLPTPDRAGGIARYDPCDLQRLRFIRAAQHAGFTLAEARELLTLDAGQDRDRAHALAARRIAALDAKIARMREARDALSRLADACARGHGPTCPIIATFENADGA